MDQDMREKLTTLLVSSEALLGSMNLVITSTATDGPNNLWKYAGYNHYIRNYNKILDAVTAVDPNLTITLEKWNQEKVPGLGDSLPDQQKSFIVGTHLNLSILVSLLQNRLGLKDDKILALVDFFESSLRKAVHKIPEKETEIQDVIENLLIGRGLSKGVDYDREAGHVKIAHKHTVPDFIMKSLNLAIEIKLSKDERKSKVLVDEINADILAYGKEYSRIIFIVYDLGSIRDATEFCRDLEAVQGITVKVVKH